MADTISTNVTQARYTIRNVDGTLPTTPVYLPLEPNEYNKFGSENKLVARNYINDSRQRSKGNIVDRSAYAGITQDITTENMQPILAGFMFANVRTKNMLTATAVTTTAYTVPSGGAVYKAGDLIFVTGATTNSNNGLKKVTGSTATTVVVSGLSAETGQTINIVRVGFEFATTDAEIDVTGSGDTMVVALETTAKSLTELGLIPGEYVYFGGDQTIEQFATANNNTYMQVKSVATNRIIFSETQLTPALDAGTGKTIRMFFGQPLKNEAAADIRTFMFDFERQLGSPDESNPSQIQVEYVEKAVASEMSLTMEVGKLITASFDFLGTQHILVPASEGLRTGTRPILTEGDAYGPTTNIKYISLNLTDSILPLFARIESLDLSVKNNLVENKALGYEGSFSITPGTFEVSAKMTAYFVTVDALNAVRQNLDVSMHIHLAKDNRGLTISLPLGALGDGSITADMDEALRVNLTFDAARGKKVDINTDFTLMFVFWNYLPNRAM